MKSIGLRRCAKMKERASEQVLRRPMPRLPPVSVVSVFRPRVWILVRPFALHLARSIVYSPCPPRSYASRGNAYQDTSRPNSSKKWPIFFLPAVSIVAARPSLPRSAWESPPCTPLPFRALHSTGLFFIKTIIPDFGNVFLTRSTRSPAPAWERLKDAFASTIEKPYLAKLPGKTHS